MELGDVRAVDVAELALEALVDDLVLLRRRHPAGVLIVVSVDHLEQRREGRAELEAQTASVAQVVDPRQFLADIGFVRVERMLRVVCGRHAGDLSCAAGRREVAAEGACGGAGGRSLTRPVRRGTPAAERSEIAALSERITGRESVGELAGVALLGAGERLEPVGDLVEALVAGGLGEAGVHLGVLVGLTGDGRLQVVLGVADRLARCGVTDFGEVLEVAVGVAGLAFGDRAEQHRRVGVALDVGLLGEPQVAAVGLALAGERFGEVLVGLGTCEVWHWGLLWEVGGWDSGRRRRARPAGAMEHDRRRGRCEAIESDDPRSSAPSTYTSPISPHTSHRT